MVLAKSMFIFLNERSFFTVFAPLTCLDHIPFELLLFGPTRYEISEKIRALACPLFEISTRGVPWVLLREQLGRSDDGLRGFGGGPPTAGGELSGY